jgi:hypothetical protein
VSRQRQLLSENDDDDGAAHFQGRGIGADGPEVELGSEKNEAAANAIAKIQEKLQGYEDGTSGEQQSVEGQVQLLINSAKDPDNVRRMGTVDVRLFYRFGMRPATPYNIMSTLFRNSERWLCST